MSSFSTVSIYNDLSTGESGIAVWPTDHKFASRINMIFNIVVEKGLKFGLQTAHHTWDQDTYNIRFDFFKHICLAVELIVLSGNNDTVDAQWLVLVVVFNSDLRLGIGSEIVNLLAFSTKCSELDEEFVGKIKRQRHVVFRFIIGVAEHNSLIACTLVLFIFACYSLVDIGRLFVDS